MVTRLWTGGVAATVRSHSLRPRCRFSPSVEKCPSASYLCVDSTRDVERHRLCADHAAMAAVCAGRMVAIVLISLLPARKSAMVGQLLSFFTFSVVESALNYLLRKNPLHGYAAIRIESRCDIHSSSCCNVFQAVVAWQGIASVVESIALFTCTSQSIWHAHSRLRILRKFRRP